MQFINKIDFCEEIFMIWLHDVKPLVFNGVKLNWNGTKDKADQASVIRKLHKRDSIYFHWARINFRTLHMLIVGTGRLKKWHTSLKVWCSQSHYQYLKQLFIKGQTKFNCTSSIFSIFDEWHVFKYHFIFFPMLPSHMSCQNSRARCHGIADIFLTIVQQVTKRFLWVDFIFIL